MCTQSVWLSTQAEVFWVAHQTAECLTLRWTQSEDSLRSNAQLSHLCIRSNTSNQWRIILCMSCEKVIIEQVLWAMDGPNGFDWSMVRLFCLEWRGIPVRADHFRSGEVFCYAAKAGQFFLWLLPAHISWSMNNNQHLRFAHLGEVMHLCIYKLGNHWFGQFSYNRMNLNMSSLKMR